MVSLMPVVLDGRIVEHRLPLAEPSPGVDWARFATAAAAYGRTAPLPKVDVAAAFAPAIERARRARAQIKALGG
jgi:hypothetical protein